MCWDHPAASRHNSRASQAGRERLRTQLARARPAAFVAADVAITVELAGARAENSRPRGHRRLMPADSAAARTCQPEVEWAWPGAASVLCAPELRRPECLPGASARGLRHSRSPQSRGVASRAARSDAAMMARWGLHRGHGDARGHQTVALTLRDSPRPSSHSPRDRRS